MGSKLEDFVTGTKAVLSHLFFSPKNIGHDIEQKGGIRILVGKPTS